MASITVQDDGRGTYKIRWRERVRIGDDDVKVVDRARRVTGKAARDKLVAKIREDLEIHGYFIEDARPMLPPSASFDQAGAGWLVAQSARGLAQSSLDTYAKHLNRFARLLRGLRGLTKETPIPAEAITRDTLAAVIVKMREAGLSDATVYDCARIAVEIWTWAADDPVTYPGFAPPPRVTSTLLPRPPAYSAPEAPTLAEVDACLRHLPPTAHQARTVGLVMRYTGLRVHQVLEIRVGDLDLGGATLTVRKGKGRREHSERRTVPVATGLVEALRPLVDGVAEDERLIRRRRDLESGSASTYISTFTKAWEAATRAGEARRKVWAPENRKNARPEHAFRAALQAHMVEAGVRDAVIDALVGHASKGTRARHYVDETSLAKAMRSAVEALPSHVDRG